MAAARTSAWPPQEAGPAVALTTPWELTVSSRNEEFLVWVSKVVHSSTLLERVQTENCLTWWLNGHQAQVQPSLSPNSIALTVPQNTCPQLLECESLYSYTKKVSLIPALGLAHIALREDYMPHPGAGNWPQPSYPHGEQGFPRPELPHFLWPYELSLTLRHPLFLQLLDITRL